MTSGRLLLLLPPLQLLSVRNVAGLLYQLLDEFLDERGLPRGIFMAVS